MPIRTILVDDEPLALAELRLMLQVHPEVEILGTANNSVEAKEMIRVQQPHLLFLDVEMPGGSGFDLLQSLDEAPAVIFVTAYDRFAIRGFEVNALDYLLKPVDPDRLQEAIGKVKRQLTVSDLPADALSIEKRIFIKDGEACYFVPLAEIFLIESVGNYARVFYQDKRPLLHKSLNYLEDRLPGTHFFRTGRRHIVNLNYIKTIYPVAGYSLKIELHNGFQIELSQRRTTLFKDRMGV